MSKVKILLIFVFMFILILIPINVFAYDESNLEPENGIPLVIVRVDESQTSIDDMNGSYQHSVRCNDATVEIKIPEGYNNELVTFPLEEIDLDYIRGRGNSTWDGADKKPYKIQLKNKLNLFGMGESKDWALLANAFDESLIRNKITSWLGEQMGLSYTPNMIPVDLVLIGSNSGVHVYGSYFLSETIKVEETRIDIDKLKKNDTENITGGYLLAIYSDQKEDTPASTHFSTAYGVEILNDTPEYDDTEKELTEAQLAQREYIKNYIQELEDLIMKPGEIDESRHNKIAEMLDLQSTVDYWLINEFAYNTDGFATSSTYLYKERDGKLYFGPLWDFDNAWNNNGMWNESNETLNNLTMKWIDQLRDKDPLFVKLIKERWQLMNQKLIELDKNEGIIDEYKAEINASKQKDYEIWNNGIGDYDEIIKALKTWIEERRVWVNTNINDEADKVFFTVTYENNGKIIATERVRYGDTGILDPDTSGPEGQVLDYWKVKGGSKKLSKQTIKKDTTFEPIFIDKDEAIEPEEFIILLEEQDKVVDLSDRWFSLNDITEVNPYYATNQRITWTLSNEKVGTIDMPNKKVDLIKSGKTTITGTLYNGLTASFVLKVTDVNGLNPDEKEEKEEKEDIPEESNKDKENENEDEEDNNNNTLDESTSNNPETGDNIVIWINILLISMLGIKVTLSILNLKDKDYE